MKINNNKIINTFITAACVLLLSFVTGCTGLSEPPAIVQKNSGNDGIELRGSIGFAGRTATAGLNLNEMEFEIYAYKMRVGADETGETEKSEKIEPKDYVSGPAFMFTFPEEAEYTVTVKAKTNDVVFAEGSVSQFVRKEFNEPIFISLLFVYDGENYGSVKLPVNVDRAASESVNKLEVIWEAERDKDALYDFDSSGKTLITVDRIGVLAHPVRLNFLDAAGNVLYSCNEMINVYPGLETNTWYGSAPYLADGVFTVTGEMIAAYGASIVPNTKTILFNYQYIGPDGVDTFNPQCFYSYYLVDDSQIGSSPSSPAVGSQAQTDESSIHDFTSFDKDGNFYLFQKGFSGLNSNRENWSSEAIDGFEFIRDFTIDLKTNKAYFLYGAEGQNHIYQYTDLISSNGTSSSYEDMELGLSNDLDYSHFAVYDDTIYLLIFNSGSHTYDLYVYKFTEGNGSYPLMAKPIDVRDIFRELSTNEEVSGFITDVLYQDDNLYMLYKESAGHWSSGDMVVNSRGGVIKFNTITQTFTSIGFTNNKFAADSGYTLATFDNNGRRMYADEYLTNYFSPTEGGISKYPVVYFPFVKEGETIAKDQLYGPTKFVAIKPKKLVIADEGMRFYYGDEDENRLHCKNVNRIVYVDLEDFSIKENEIKSVGANTSLTNDLKYDLKCDIYEDNHLDYWVSNGDAPTSAHVTAESCYYVHILNDDCEN